MNKILVLTYDSSESIHPLDKEKIVLGRGSDCDIKLDNDGISRQHAAITFRFDSIYVENLSSSGQILKDGEPIEYVQLGEEEEVVIGPYTLFWAQKSKYKGQEGLAPKEEFSPQDNNDSQDLAPSSEEEAMGIEADEIIEASNGEQAEQGEQDVAVDFAIPSMEDEQNEAQANVDFAPLAPENNNKTESGAPNKGDLSELGESPTSLLSIGGPYAVLSVLKGEEIGREIRLDHGVQWTVGRGAGAEAQVNSPKISRSHFRILKISGGYRVQDLGSSNGTRLNGVAISDAPLQVFDTIKAGPVELQFKVVDPKHLPAQGLVAIGNHSQSSGDERTAFAAPMPYQQTNYTSGASASAKSSHHDEEFATPNVNASKEEPSINKIHPKDKIILWWNEQPKPRKLLLVTAAIILLALGLLPSEKKEGPQPASTTTQATPNAELNAANTNQISPEFNLKSEDEKKRIEDLYVEAHSARKRRDWKTAFNAAAAILDPKSGVKKYKDTAEILDEAQTYLNEQQVGTLTKNISVLEEAKLRSEEKVDVLIESGEKAIQEGRWEDAQEAFTKAMTLDPNNKQANKGFTAAFSKNPDALADEDIPEVPQTVDPFKEARLKEEEEIEELQKQYQDAKLAIFDGNYRQSIPTLDTIEKKLEGKIESFQEDGTSRLPASESEKYSTQSRALLSLVKEAKDRVNSEFRMEYQGQMSDAEVAISNKQYVQAREIYDNIVRRDPAYQEPTEARSKLYELIIAEAKNQYHEGLVYESVGDLTSAVTSFKETLSLLKDVEEYSAEQYRNKAHEKLKVLN
ncbi:FHA domain-containing protein [bacterium]|nr:FHA domain-containing protein [bacterium]